MKGRPQRASDHRSDPVNHRGRSRNSPPSASSEIPHFTTSPNLSTLPTEILLTIASLTNEPTIWSLRATCRALREVGKEAIKPYLAEQTIAARPRFMLDQYNAINYSTCTQIRKGRHAKLVHINQRFSDHLKANPASASYLRKLTLELGGDTQVGWPLLERFLQQLEHLSIHAVHGTDNPNGLSAAIVQRWQRLFEHLSILLLPRLVTLSINTTSGSLLHLHQLARWTPNLRELHLGNHWSNEMSLIPGLSTSARLVHLRKLSLIGSASFLIQAMTFIQPLAPNVRQLIISEQMSNEEPRSRALSLAVSSWPTLDSLALYGETALGLLADIYLCQRVFSTLGREAKFEKIKTLAIEYECPGDRPHYSYPFMTSSLFRPSFPSLHRIALIHHPEIKPPIPLAGPGAAVLYEEGDLRELFTHYPLLHHMQWVSGRPLDPFAVDDPAAWAERKVICTVQRPETTPDGKFAPFQPVYPNSEKEDPSAGSPEVDSNSA